MISDEMLDKVRNANDIVDVIGEYVTLRKKGVNYVGICPFHQDTRPSMFVSPARQIFKCFVCGAGGDVVGFLMQHEQMSFPDAVEWLARRAGMELPRQERDPEQERLQRERESRFVAVRAASLFFRQHIGEAKAYLHARGFELDERVLSDFRVGYAPAGNKALASLTAAGYRQDRLIEVGVLGQDGSRVFDRFQDRLMFPFLDLHGREVGFSGRLTRQAQAAKYVNTPDTPIFTKGDHLFGLFQARQEIVRQDRVYLVEGQFDVMSMAAAGVRNVVAGSGTALTDAQVSLLHRFASRITLLYDADDAGLKASLRNCESLLRAGFQVSAIPLPEGMDPDDLARQQKEELPKWLSNRTVDFVAYFTPLLRGVAGDPNRDESAIRQMCRLVSVIPSETLRLSCVASLAARFDTNTEVIQRKMGELLHDRKAMKLQPLQAMKPGLYGIDEARELRRGDEPCILTSDYGEFLQLFDDEPVVLVNGVPDTADLQRLRQVAPAFVTDAAGISLSQDGVESDYLKTLCLMFKGGVSAITVRAEAADGLGDADEEAPMAEEWNFAKYYVGRHRLFLKSYTGDPSPFIERCVEVISCADDSVRVVNFSFFQSCLQLTKNALTELLKPYLAKRKARMAIAAQRTDDDYDELYDPDELPRYVEENPDYMQMYRQCQYYPKLNKEGEPVCYMFENAGKGHTQVGDFYMTPLLHIYSDNPDDNKRVLKINRRYYKTPLYIEVPSKALLKKSTIEEWLIMLEAVNFTNGEEKHWTKIREYMSRHYVTCSEVLTYGNQQEDGFSQKEDQMFFAFANGIFHTVDGQPRFDAVNELGVVTHNGRNYYLPAYSTIYAGSGRSSDKYELISQLTFREVPADKRVSFGEWASLMDRVYKINHNGKWAVLYAVMCAFRSNIHCIDRLFTAPFFMGPMSSGKTQIAISIRSLFISPKIPIFNLNIGTDAAMSTLMSTFRDVPVVLDEYNNKDISDVKFQALKGIVYDGDGRQKRKGASGREIENDKVFAPVIICGQETPQRDDNALMSRIIVCEVPKPRERTREETDLFNRLKDIEDPSKIGLSNVLLQVLSIRPLVMKHFRALKQQAYDELKEALATAGEIDRLMKTASLFLATCRLLQDYTDLQLPFTYDDFFKIAVDKIRTQLELISKTDKLATFFKAMDAMIDTKVIKEGRDFAIDTPDTLTFTLPGREKRVVSVPAGTRVLFLRVASVFTKFQRSSFNPEDTTQSTIDQNLRSCPAYMGYVINRKFSWYETVDTPRGGIDDGTSVTPGVVVNNELVRRVERQSTQGSCVALNYNVFMDMYGIDLRRGDQEQPADEPAEPDSMEQPLPY